MGTYYSQISIEERCEVARLLAQGTSYGKIATALGRARSTIIREGERNGSSKAGYQARYAQEQGGGAPVAREAVGARCRIAQLVQAYNHTPRKCLDFQTPAQVYVKQVLHLKCEPTFPRKRE